MGNLFAEREASLRTRRGRPNPEDEGRSKAISPPQEMGVTHSGNAKENEATRPLSRRKDGEINAIMERFIVDVEEEEELSVRERPRSPLAKKLSSSLPPAQP